MATWRRLRSHRWRRSIRKAVPCSLGVIGKSVLGPRMASSRTVSSTPPGERASERTCPSSRTDVSWVSFANRSQVSGATSCFASTPWTTPVPSRSTTNAIFPEERVVVTQPLTATGSPTWDGSSAIQ